MIQVCIEYNEKNLVISVSIEGHAEFAEKGNDIVCSSVSTLVQSLIIGIEEVLGYSGFMQYPETTAKNIMPVVVVNNPDPVNQKVNILFETFRISLSRIAVGYPQNVKLMEVYVK